MVKYDILACLQVYATGGKEGVQVWSDAGQLLLHIPAVRPDLSVKKVSTGHVLVPANMYTLI